MPSNLRTVSTSTAVFLLFAATTACSDDGATDDIGDATMDGTDGESSTEEETGESESSTDTTDSTTDDTTDSTTDSTTDGTTDDTTDGTTDDTTDGTTGDTTDDTTDDATDTTDGGDVCGDSMVTGSEVCDDGVNDGAYGGCNADCLSLADYCGDAVVNGPEQCDDANADLADGCLDNCAIPEDCLDLYEYDDMLDDGVYLIAPAGFMGDPFPAYCDMTTDGGGWTLAMRFAPAMGEFDFWSTHWTTGSVLNEMVTDPADPSDGKFPAYNVVPGTGIRGCLQNPMDQAYGCKVYDLPMLTTLLDVFTNTEIGSDIAMKGLYFMEAQPEMIEWLTIQGRTLAQSTVPNPGYVRVGINIDDDQSCYDARVRFGLVLNNENTIFTLNDTAGFGAQAYYTAACDLMMADSGWRTPSGFAAGPTIYTTPGHIWVR